MRTNAEALNLQIGFDYLEHELPFRVRHRLPGLSHAQCLFLRCHFSGEAGYDLSAFEGEGCLHDC